MIRFIRFDLTTVIISIVLASILIAVNIMIRKGKNVSKILLYSMVAVWAAVIVRCAIVLITGG